MSNSQGLTTWCSPHMKAITVLLYRNYPKMFISWMFCFAEELISGIENTIMEPDWKKTHGFSTHFRLSGVVDWAIVSLYVIYVGGCSLGCLPNQQIFRKITELYNYIYMYSKILCKV